MNENTKIEIASNFLESLLIGDKTNCSALVKQYLAINPSIMDLYEEVLKKALYKVGVLWETNKISVASEHLATAITEGILNELFEQIISKKRFNKKVIVTCVENEAHQVGIKMVADVFEMNGWESFFIGTGIPLKELIRYIHQIKPDVVAISLSLYFNYTNLLEMLKKLRAEFPVLQFIVGGQAFSHLSENSLTVNENMIHIPDLYLLDKYIRTMNSKL